jgi:hypothetical protein
VVQGQPGPAATGHVEQDHRILVDLLLDHRVAQAGDRDRRGRLDIDAFQPAEHIHGLLDGGVIRGHDFATGF